MKNKHLLMVGEKIFPSFKLPSDSLSFQGVHTINREGYMVQNVRTFSSITSWACFRETEVMFENIAQH